MQESGNATQQIARCESRLRVMLKIREIAFRNERLSDQRDPQWDRVKREAVRGGCPFKDEIDALVDAVQELSGGLENPVLLDEYRDLR